jgi:DNA-binding transcriptional regulator GbsR (MarR family)
MPDLPAELLRAQDLTIDTLGRLTRFWGFTHTLGRVYGLLYLSDEPLDREAIQARLGISAGNASMALKELLRWGVAHKAWIRGNRRIHYRAEVDFWRMISNVLNERERRQVQTAAADVTRALTLARGARRDARGALRDAVDFNIARMERLLELYTLAQRLLDLLLSTLRVDISSVRTLFRTG